MIGSLPTAADAYCARLLLPPPAAGACMMMEFGYNGQILETFTPLGLVNQQKEEWLMWLVKTEVLPWAYWNLMTKGFVPWSEVKNVIKRFRAQLAQGGKTAATL